LQENKEWKLRTIESGHDAMLDKPDEVASLLLDVAGQMVEDRLEQPRVLRELLQSDSAARRLLRTNS
jgi:hypothetical protein